MRFDVITIFPELIRDAMSHSIPGRALEAGQIELHTHDLRDYADDRHKTVDDTPYGGGAGMIFKPGPMARAIEDVRGEDGETPLIYLTADGDRLDQAMANRFSLMPRLILLCGHYRGIDERIRAQCVTHEVSIGDYVLSGGEFPALVLMDAVTRLIPSVIGDAESALDDSFQNGLLDCPWYTRPREFRGMAVPDVLLSGDHGAVDEWRLEQMVERTRIRRPELLENRDP